MWWLLTDWWIRGFLYKGLNPNILWGQFCTEDFCAATSSWQMLGGVLLDQLYISSEKNKWKNMVQILFVFCISRALLMVNTCTPWNCAMYPNSSLPILWALHIPLPCQSSEAGVWCVPNTSSRYSFLSAMSFLLLELSHSASSADLHEFRK